MLLPVLLLAFSISAFSQQDPLILQKPSISRFVPVAGINAKGNTFTIRWGFNHTTLVDSPRVVGLGSSTLAGVGLSSPHRLPDKILAWLKANSSSPTWINLAVKRYSSCEVLPPSEGGTPGSDIETALSYNPDIVFVSLPSNDAAQRFPVRQSMEYYRLIDRLAIKSGAVVFFQTTQPRSELDGYGQWLLKELADSVRVVWPDRYVEGFNDLVDTKAATAAYLLKQYDKGDGIHLTTEGNQFIADHLFERWNTYFKPVNAVAGYIIETSSDMVNWTVFDRIPDMLQMKRTYERKTDKKTYFRVCALYNTGDSSAYSVTGILPSLSDVKLMDARIKENPRVMNLVFIITGFVLLMLIAILARKFLRRKDG